MCVHQHGTWISRCSVTSASAVWLTWVVAVAAAVGDTGATGVIWAWAVDVTGAAGAPGVLWAVDVAWVVGVAWVEGMPTVPAGLQYCHPAPLKRLDIIMPGHADGLFT